MHATKKLITALAVTLALAGCTTTTGLIDPDNLYPKALTSCAGEPVVPTRPAANKARTTNAVAGYTKDLHGAYEDCHDTVDGWAQRRGLYVKQYEQATEGYFTHLWHAIVGDPASK